MGQARQPDAPSPQSGPGSAPHGHVRVGDYELGDVIGDRGTGTVHCARHVPSDKQVAIKILHSRRQDVVDGLVRGAKAVSRVHHPNLVDITDVGATRDGTVYLAMELLTGESLQDRLHRVGPLPLFESINIVRQVAHGLGAAHAADVVHGGLEPAKIFLCRRDGRRRVVRRNKAADMKLVVEPEGKFDLVKILDLGLKRFLDLASYQSDLRETARYWSPEQAQRRPIDVRSDIYSLGAVFYEMITGTAPFDGASLAEVLRKHVSGLVTAPSQRTPTVAIDALVDTVILRCLQKTPGLRFASTDELCDALDACVTDCAFLRDAHRLPGIETSGIDLPEARAKPRHAPEEAKKPVGQGPAPQNRNSETRVAKPAPSPVAPKPAAARPTPSAATPATISGTRAVEPPPATPTTRAIFEKTPVRTSPPLPPRLPVTHVAPPPLAMTTTPPEPIPTVDQSALTEIVTPPPIALSSDLLTEVADVPALAETETAATAADFATVSVEASRHVAPEAPVSQITVPTVAPDSGKTVKPEATGSVADALAATSESTKPIEPLPATSATPESAESIEPQSLVSSRNEEVAHAEASNPVEAAAPTDEALNGGDRVDGSDDGQDDLLAGAWERWRRPKVMALAGVAMLGAIGIAVWTSRGRPTSPTSARQAVAKPSPSQPAPPPVQTPLPPREPTPPQAAEPSEAVGPSPTAASAQAAAPAPMAEPAAPTLAAPTPVSAPPPPVVAATETPPTVQVPAPPALAPVAAASNRSDDKPTLPAPSGPIAPAATATEAVRPAEAPPTGPAAVATEPKPPSPKPRVASTVTKPVTPAAREATTTEAVAPPKQAAAAPANLPPRLAAAWASAAQTAIGPAAPASSAKLAPKSTEQPRPGSKATTQPAQAHADQLVREAQQAWLGGQHAFALSRAQAALAASPTPAQAVQAYEIVATCSCALHKRERALEAASHLNTSRRESVKAVCAKNGVPFE